MNYKVHIRAFFETTNRNKADYYAREAFAGLCVQVVGPSLKNESLMEVTAAKSIEYSDDKTALWETIQFLSAIGGRWEFHEGPNESGTVFSALTTWASHHPQLRWCHVTASRSSDASD